MNDTDKGTTGFQAGVKGWMDQTFPPEVIADRIERAMRFLEEATELCQSVGLTHDKASVVLDYVFGRPIGEPAQEVGGSMVTLAALCATIGEDMAECGQREFDRINMPEMRAKIAAKQVSKRLFGITSGTGAVAEFCDHCGRRQLEALSSGSTHCAPPHISQPHSFTGKHPAERPHLGGIFT